MQVVEEASVPGKEHHWQMSFDDGSSVVVEQVNGNAPPYFRQIDGDFTNDRIVAIVNYSRLAVRPQ